MATVMLAGYVLMPVAMLAPVGVAGVKFTMLAIHVAMIVTMPAAPAATVPAAMLRAMIASLVAMEVAMLTPARIGRMQVPVLPSRVSMGGPMAGAGLTVAVAWSHNIDVRIRMSRPSFDLLGALGTPRFRPFGPLGAPCCTVHFATVGVSGVAAHAFMPTFLILGEGGHRRSTGKEKGNNEFAHLDTPAETSPLMRRFFRSGL
ncbi:MAG: hypothetical protein M3R03_10570 [Pseudomonadota bacterium]|nr:hypothetical protein [Pseudomonadota bacterium]